MSERRLLYLTQHQLLAFHWRGGALTQEGEFVPEEAGERFATYLADHPDSLFSLVVNLGEEGFQADVIPFLQGRDRAAVIHRRLGQSFLGAPLAIAIPHGHESGTRKNERLLLTALTSIAQLEPWLNALGAAATRLQGIYSLPLLSEPLLRKLGIVLERGLLISIQDNTVRQSFFSGGRLTFSRMAPLTGHSIAEVAQSVAQEANRFHQFLLSQRMVARGEKLPAHALLPPQVIGAVQASSFHESVVPSLHDNVLAARKLGLRTPSPDGRAQALFLHCAVAAPPPHQFATAAMRQSYRFWRLGNVIRAGGMLAFAACALIAGKFAIDAAQARDAAASQQAVAAHKDNEYRGALAKLPPVPLANDDLRQLYERVESLRRQTDTPTAALAHLARVLDAAPAVELVDLEWIAPGGARDNVGAAAGRGPLGDRESLRVKGQLQLRPAGSPRQVVTAFDDFVRHLRDGQPAAQITVVQTPIDLNAGRALKSADSASGARAPREFVVQIDYPEGK